jgi:hypothetical protein
VCQSGWSASFPLGVPVDPRVGSLTFVHDEVDGNPDIRPSGTFGWLSWPAGAYEGIEFACGDAPGGTFLAADTTQPGSCHVDIALMGTPYLTIRVIANGGQAYDITYDGLDYD